MSRRWVLIALFVSLACNLFLVGGVVGGLVVGARFKAAAAAPRAPLMRAADDLPIEHRQAYRQALREAARAMAPDLRQARQARREAWQGLTRDAFDAAQVTADLDRARLGETQARAAVEHRIVAFAGTLPPEERAELARGLLRAGPRARRPQGGDGGRPAPQPPPP